MAGHPPLNHITLLSASETDHWPGGVCSTRRQTSKTWVRPISWVLLCSKTYIFWEIMSIHQLTKSSLPTQGSVWSQNPKANHKAVWHRCLLKSLLCRLMAALMLNIFSKFDTINGHHFHNEQKMVVGYILNIKVLQILWGTFYCSLQVSLVSLIGFVSQFALGRFPLLLGNTGQKS